MTTRTALIGYTGFVGRTLAGQRSFDDTFNSKNIEEIAGREYDFIACAGARAEKWRANADPDADWRALTRLAEPLCRARARKLLLISTVDVYPSPVQVDENVFINPGAEAYGRHRLLLEKFLADHFDTLIVRLPGLFGKGLKKNVIYDFLHENQLEKIDSRGSFQFYDMRQLWADCQTALQQPGLRLVNFAVEPVTVAEVARVVLGRDFEQVPDRSRPPASYDFRTRHAAVFGGSGGYLHGCEEVLRRLAEYADAERRGPAA